MKSLHRLAPVVAVGAVALLVTSCGSRPSGSGDSSSASGSGSYQACMVLDTGGVDDRSFNQSSYAGLTAAAKENSDIAPSFVASSSANDYEPNLNAEVAKGCDTVIGVGGLMSDQIKKVAEANPDQHFAEIDSSSGADNVYGMQYDTAQGGFLGGYLAASMTSTGTVGTWGGLNIPPVTIYMDGFWEGVQYYNAQKGKAVKVLGWDENNPSGGTFVGGDNGFTDQAAGKSITETMLAQGADIVMPVAGQAGLGAGAAAEANDGKLNLIWVDTDGCVSASQYCKYFISSVTKNLTDAVKDYTLAAAKGDTPTGNYVGTLENGGTGLASFNQFDAKVSADTKTELDTIKADIISGEIKITSKNSISAS